MSLITLLNKYLENENSNVSTEIFGELLEMIESSTSVDELSLFTLKGEELFIPIDLTRKAYERLLVLSDRNKRVLERYSLFLQLYYAPDDDEFASALFLESQAKH